MKVSVDSEYEALLNSYGMVVLPIIGYHLNCYEEGRNMSWLKQDILITLDIPTIPFYPEVQPMNIHSVSLVGVRLRCQDFPLKECKKMPKQLP